MQNILTTNVFSVFYGITISTFFLGCFYEQNEQIGLYIFTDLLYGTLSIHEKMAGLFPRKCANVCIPITTITS